MKRWQVYGRRRGEPTQPPSAVMPVWSGGDERPASGDLTKVQYFNQNNVGSKSTDFMSQFNRNK